MWTCKNIHSTIVKNLQVKDDISDTFYHHFEIAYFCFMKILNLLEAPLSIAQLYYVFWSLFSCQKRKEKTIQGRVLFKGRPGYANIRFFSLFLRL